MLCGQGDAQLARSDDGGGVRLRWNENMIQTFHLCLLSFAAAFTALEKTRNAAFTYRSNEEKSRTEPFTVRSGCGENSLPAPYDTGARLRMPTSALNPELPLTPPPPPLRGASGFARGLAPAAHRRRSPGSPVSSVFVVGTSPAEELVQRLCPGIKKAFLSFPRSGPPSLSPLGVYSATLNATEGHWGDAQMIHRAVPKRIVHTA
ncbi:unnamed protein product [Pleuronectes platessa]|uniref:Uncharacterized protein n=1 Tax=Pleuronectes platessa TaxID=8262 RepID=A0A9N7VLE2_PLEPL|nr:unnamed protein product [Pleuronectes platessa]